MQNYKGEPAELAAQLERGAAVPEGPGDRFLGYAVMGLPFTGGDVLALRRFPNTSAGVGYTSVWHRVPDGQWTFYADVPADQGCSRYWGAVVDRTVVAPIRVEWTGERSLTVSVDGGRLVSWSLSLASSPAIALVNTIGGWLPESAWSSPRVLRAMELAGRGLLGTGHLCLHGRTPNGYEFISNPLAVWSVAASRATVAGRDLGPAGRARAQAALGEFWIPQRGLFAIGNVRMHRPDADVVLEAAR